MVSKRLPDEHDDDSASEVQNEATEETDSFPSTADDVDGETDADAANPLKIDEDESEL